MRSSATGMMAFGLITAAILLLPAGCVQIGDGVVDGGGDGGGSFVADDEVLVVFRNLSTSDAVDVEFHATNDALDSLPDDLFVDDYLVKSGIGLAGTGIVGPLGVDAVTFPCTSTLSIGTAGGDFLDNSTGEQTGRGTPRWAETTALGLCGTIITFTFDESGGEFTTRVGITR